MEESNLKYLGMPAPEILREIGAAWEVLQAKVSPAPTAHSLVGLIKQQGFKEVDVFTALGISRKAWDRVKHQPELLTLKRSHQLAEFIGVPVESVYALTARSPDATPEPGFARTPSQSATTPPANGETIFELLSRTPLSNQQLTAHLAISNSTWTRLRKDFAELTLKRLARLAECLQVSPGDLLSGILRCYPDQEQETRFEGYSAPAQATSDERYRFD